MLKNNIRNILLRSKLGAPIVGAHQCDPTLGSPRIQRNKKFRYKNTEFELIKKRR
tara:strand:- start:752 stop:916 length:165 start_codon:yes stop_codon:yes gene_type:complete